MNRFAGDANARLKARTLRAVALLCFAAALWWGAGLRAATFAETNAFNAARANFMLQAWPQAEKGFADFARKYTNSEYYAAAISFEAQALFQQRRFSDAIYLLSSEQPRAGAVADEFAWWTGQSQFELTNYQGAADTFARLLKDYQASSRRLGAMVQQAAAYGKLAQWPRVIEILGKPDGPFQQLARGSPDSTDAINGFMRLAEAQLVLRDYPAAEQTLHNLGNQKLDVPTEWQRRYLLGRVQLAAGHIEQALETSTNLVELTASSLGLNRRAESLALQAEMLEQAQRLPEAIAVYQRNLGDDAAAELRRQALLKIVELNLRLDDIQAATTRLEEYLAKYPAERSSELASLTLGELRLRQYRMLAAPREGVEARPGAETNLLEQAITNFSALITASTNANFVGKAQLNLGWCLLIGRRMPESEAAFSNAVNLLPDLSEDQAVARFKLGDAQYWRKEYAGALTNYQLVLDRYHAVPAVTNTLVEPALHQIIRASLNLGDITRANEAMGHLLIWFPDSPLVDSSTLLLGQGLTRQGQAAAAREMFTAFAARAPGSPLLPELQLAVARTFEAEDRWTNAIDCYAAWLASNTNSPSRQKAEFALAFASASAGRETNALALFTNYVARYKTNALAPAAQYWIADHYWRLQQFVEAESNYKYVFQTWPDSPLAPRARLYAGKSAFELEHFPDAIDHFTNLTSRADLPRDLWLEADFAYADASRKQTNYDRAIQILKGITNNFPTNVAATLAVGLLGDCYFTLAGLDPAHYQYDAALTNYQAVIDSPLAGISARSEAEVKLGRTIESKAALAQPETDLGPLLNSALGHYLNVVQGGNLRPGEKQDLYWVKEAGLNAGQLAEKLGQTALDTGKGIEAASQWRAGLKLYQEMGLLLPSMQQFWERRTVRLQEKLAAAKGPH